MKPPFESDLLRAFATIAATQSFTLSADMLHRTQPAISMQMKRLEEAVGRPLFDRTRRGVVLTKEGEILLHYARRILALHDEARERLQQVSLHGAIRLGAPDDYATILLPEILDRFSAAQPNVQIELSCDTGQALERRLREGLIDIALVGCRGEVAAEEKLRTEDLVWIAADRYPVGARPLRIAAFPDGCVCRAAMSEALDRAGLQWRIGFASDNIRAIHQAVQAGQAVTAVERSLVPPGVRALDAAAGLPDVGTIALALKMNRYARTAALAALAADIRAMLAEDLSVDWPFAADAAGYASAG